MIALFWRHHPLFEEIKIARFGNYSIIHGDLVELGPRKYEVLSPDMDSPERFLSEAEVIEFLIGGADGGGIRREENRG
jgi:hypothetical protein